MTTSGRHSRNANADLHRGALAIAMNNPPADHEISFIQAVAVLLLGYLVRWRAAQRAARMRRVHDIMKKGLAVID